MNVAITCLLNRFKEDRTSVCRIYATEDFGYWYCMIPLTQACMHYA